MTVFTLTPRRAIPCRCRHPLHLEPGHCLWCGRDDERVHRMPRLMLVGRDYPVKAGPRPEDGRCTHPGCTTILAAANPGPTCYAHSHGHRATTIADLMRQAA